MKKLLSTSAFALTLSVAAGAAQAEDLTLCWAAWDPANALVELSKDYEAKSGNKMNFEFIPWPNFADRMLNELNSGGKLCDLLIGDSQWIGGGAENGHYVKLNDFFDANGISMDDFMPATVYAYSTWPKGTPNYYALPAMADANGWFYRKDWFEMPDIEAAFKEKYGRDLPNRRPSWNFSTSPSSSRAAKSTARKSTVPRSSPNAVPKASPWA
jgi:multiple sugar transport system substrate-binding protein